ncbi:MAG TPA: TRAP transporter large permease [Chloroflexota bacterium]|nr:TRAP transporter large permease [Chloroflexota bacterium]
MNWVLAGLPLLLLALGFPIYVIFLVSSLVVLILFMNVPLEIVVQQAFGSVDQFSLMAVPFFLFAGEVMGRGGMARRLIDWFTALLGGVRGSLGFVTVASCEFFGSISGSSPATVAALGKILYPALLQNRYGHDFSIGVVTASGAIAIIIPPSIAMILYAAGSNQSVARLFIAGVIPGLVIGLFNAVYIAYYVWRHKIPAAGRFSWPVFLRATYRAGWALGVPLIVLGGIYSGIATPTEAAGIAAVYGIVVARFFYREVTWHDILRIATESAVLTAQILVIVAASGVFSWLLTVLGVPQAITGAIRALNLSAVPVLLVITVFLQLVGMLIDPASAILVLTPLLFPIATAVGVDPVHFGIIFTVNMAIAMFTPPFGLNIFVSQALFGLPIRRIFPGLVPFIIVDLAALLVITYVPELSLWLPRLLYGR